MPSLKDLKNRIGSVKNTRKITKAMQMVAAAKLRRAQEDEPGCKAIVFSQFVAFLELIMHRLARAGVRGACGRAPRAAARPSS